MLVQFAAPAAAPIATGDARRTPAEERAVAAASPLRDGPRYRFRRPMTYSTGEAAPLLAAA
ncbi:hypothetical protein [Streptomyces sp. TLI_171]|uniref:hypothetical protein n=1 Tax=Streptomyces sp. TLI_171 TaxID=1938859 RepID=UPI00118039A6|nr:hypothetical protein [Streptomyces sp. TLI_171]